MLKLMRMLRPYALPIAAVIIVVFLQAMGDLYLPTLMSDIVNRGITNSDIEYITRTGLTMLAVALGSSICAVVGSYLSAHISMGFGEAIRGRIFRTVSGFSLARVRQGRHPLPGHAQHERRDPDPECSLIMSAHDHRRAHHGVGRHHPGRVTRTRALPGSSSS